MFDQASSIVNIGLQAVLVILCACQEAATKPTTFASISNGASLLRYVDVRCHPLTIPGNDLESVFQTFREALPDLSRAVAARDT